MMQFTGVSTSDNDNIPDLTDALLFRAHRVGSFADNFWKVTIATATVTASVLCMWR